MREPTLIEYRVRPVTRYIVTRFEGYASNVEGGAAGGSGSVCGRGEFDNAETAYEVGYALAKADHARMGWPIDDPRIQYPQHLEPDVTVKEVDSQHFSVPVENVLAGARGLIEVAVVGIDDEGEVYVASSMGTPQTKQLFDRVRPRIDELAEGEES
jgi:hypothetical protein